MTEKRVVPVWLVYERASGRLVKIWLRRKRPLRAEAIAIYFKVNVGEMFDRYGITAGTAVQSEIDKFDGVRHIP